MSGFKNILARLAVLPAACLVALSGFAARERGVSATPAEWRFSSGPEFPGATGKLEKNGGALRLDGDFTKGGGYVAAFRRFDFPEANRLVFRVKTDASTVAVRLRDETGQVHQHHFPIGRKGEWQEIIVPFLPARKHFWGGRADGTLTLPVTEFGILIHKRHVNIRGCCEISGVRLIAAPESRPEEPLDLARYDASKVSVNGNASVSGNGSALLVTIPAEQTISWPGINLRPQNGSPFFDLSRCSVLAMDVKNLSGRQIAVKCQIENLGANGREFCIRGGRAFDAGETATLRVRYYRSGIAPDDVKFEGVLSPFEGLSGRNTLDVEKITNIMLFTRPSGKEVKFEVSNIRLEEPFAGVSDAVGSAAAFYPAIDRFGQYKHKEWPGKTHSEADLVEAEKRERADLSAHPRPAGRNRFGGWAAGPSLEATGSFRTAKHDGRWYLVDPEGKLFFSHGICQFEQVQYSGVTFREHYFEGIPLPGEAAGKEFYRKMDYAPGNDNFYRRMKTRPDVFDFFGWNLRKKYGGDFRERYRERLFERAASWGINTMGNWSLAGYARQGRLPYVLQAYSRGAPAIQGHRGIWQHFQDVFDPRFEKAVETYLRTAWAFAADDPMCLGIFVDNEHAWGNETALAEAVLASPAGQAAKREFRRRLEAKYGPVEKLNEAWNTAYASYDAFLESTALPDPDRARSDLLAFNDAIVERYFEGARNAVKRFAPDKLYLGCRFAGTPNTRIVKTAARYCDVLSFNIYEYSVEDFRLPDNIDMPVIIGEFHFGTLADGHSYPGLQGSASQPEHGSDYLRYVEGALRNPLLVGTHYYRLIDQSPAGRSQDNENIGFGFLDICDRPCPEMVRAAREAAEKLYEIRSGKQKPSNRKFRQP